MTTAADEKDFLKALGLQVAKVRKERGLTQAALHRITGLSVEYISRLENGRGNSTVLTLRILVQEGLSCPLDVFFDRVR